MIGVFLALIAVELLYLCYAFFACCETAFTSVSRAWLWERAEDGDKRAILARRLLENAGSFFGTVLLGTNLVTVTVTTLFRAVIAIAVVQSSWFLRFAEVCGISPAQEDLITSIVLTPTMLLFTEMVPKAIGRSHPEAICLRLASPLNVIRILLKPLVRVLEWFSRRLTRLAGAGGTSEVRVTRDDLKILATVATEQGLIGKEAEEMMNVALELNTRTIDEIAVSPVDVKTLPLSATVADVEELARTTGFTRFPVYDGRQDNIIGLVSLRRCIFDESLHDKDPTTIPIQPLVERDILFVPEFKTVGALLLELRTANSPMAIVIDEYGGMAGIVTMEDIIGTLVGGIADMRNQVEFQVWRIDDNTFECDGKAELADLEPHLGFPVQSEEYETAAGLALNLFGRIPTQGATVTYKGWRIQVLEMARHRIARLRFHRLTKHAR